MELITINNQIGVSPEATEWIRNTQHFDPRCLLYPSTALLQAATKEKSIMYMALQTPIILGPFAVNPAASKFEVSNALREMFVVAKVLAQRSGQGEILVLTADQSVKDFATKVGMEKFPDCDVYRKITLEK